MESLYCSFPHLKWVACESKFCIRFLGSNLHFLLLFMSPLWNDEERCLSPKVTIVVNRRCGLRWILGLPIRFTSSRNKKYCDDPIILLTKA